MRDEPSVRSRRTDAPRRCPTMAFAPFWLMPRHCPSTCTASTVYAVRRAAGRFRAAAPPPALAARLSRQGTGRAGSSCSQPMRPVTGQWASTRDSSAVLAGGGPAFSSSSPSFPPSSARGIRAPPLLLLVRRRLRPIITDDDDDDDDDVEEDAAAAEDGPGSSSTSIMKR